MSAGEKNQHYTFILAVVIIIAYIVFFGTVMYHQSNSTSNYEGLKTVTATFGIIVAAVVGYYFGQKPVEAAEQRAKSAEVNAEKSKSEFKKVIGTNVAEITSGEDFYKQFVNSMEKIKKDYSIE